MGTGEAGLIIIGDELLCGSRRDRHLQHVLETLQPIHWRLAWVKMLPDDESLLCDQLAQTINTELPVFCFGGIGATPDDVTRQSAARAARVPLLVHPQAVAEIEAQFGEAAYPKRIRMADLPEGCELIPNSVNRVPGFSVKHHHFMPGFPEMAWPMLDWVLQHYYHQAIEPMQERSLKVFDVGESELIDLMEELIARHPNVKLYSLPHLGPQRHIELGFRGRHGVEQAFLELNELLVQAGMTIEFP